MGGIVNGSVWRSFYDDFFLPCRWWQSNHNIIKSIGTNTLTYAGEFPMQIERNYIFFPFSFHCRTLIEYCERGIFYCSSRELLHAHDLEFAFFSATSKRREAECKLLHFLSPLNPPAWFQVLNCYFNKTTSHVPHHLHHTPSTHPARLSVDRSCAAVLRHLRNMCTTRRKWQCEKYECKCAKNKFWDDSRNYRCNSKFILHFNPNRTRFCLAPH